MGTWIRLPHMPSLRVTRPPRPDLPPVPVRLLANRVDPAFFKRVTAHVLSARFDP